MFRRHRISSSLCGMSLFLRMHEGRHLASRTSRGIVYLLVLL